jgi:arsenite methyltransferase
MAELTDSNPSAASVSSCCAPAAQETCCEPVDKAACCGTSAAGGSCGCSAGQPETRDADTLRETVRQRYAAAALATTASTATAEGGCCGTDAGIITDEQDALFGAGLYADGEPTRPRPASRTSSG